MTSARRHSTSGISSPSLLNSHLSNSRQFLFKTQVSSFTPQPLPTSAECLELPGGLSGGLQGGGLGHIGFEANTLGKESNCSSFTGTLSGLPHLLIPQTVSASQVPHVAQQLVYLSHSFKWHSTCDSEEWILGEDLPQIEWMYFPICISNSQDTKCLVCA